MPSHVLGISCYYHDSAAALVSDGEIVAAAEEERFSRRKHDAEFPLNAIEFCLDAAAIDADDLTAVVFYDSPVLNLDRTLTTFLAVAPRGADRWREFAGTFLVRKLLIAREIRKRLRTRAPVKFTRHHLSHAASAFYPSPFQDAAVLTVDGVGEWETTSIAYGDETGIQTLDTIRFPHSLGLLYSSFTYYCGFRVNSGEYKLMGLAPYGSPTYADAIRENLIDLRSDGSFSLGMDYFAFLESNRLINERFENLFGGPPRRPESRITGRETDLAASIQLVVQEAILGLARHARDRTGSPNLCLAGGVALNCVANGLLRAQNLFENIWVQPAAGDSGGALGAALLGSHELLSEPRPRRAGSTDLQKGSLLGPSYTAEALKGELDDLGCRYESVADRRQRAARIAKRLAAGEVVALCSGPMEFGPRALGSRSILADPRRADTQSRLNLKIKFRESFRPFAPAVLEEACHEYFDFDGPSPYMLMTAPVLEQRRRPVSRCPDDGDLLATVRQVRSDVPAVTHVDYSARIQTVGQDSNPELRAILEEFRDLTGCPLLVNTSLNVRGEPIVCTPSEAWTCYLNSDIDVLVVDRLIIDDKPVRGDRERRHRERPASDGAEPQQHGDGDRVDLFRRLFLLPAAERVSAAALDRLSPPPETASTFCPTEDHGGAFTEQEHLESIGSMLRRIWEARGLGEACELVQPLLELAEEMTHEADGRDLGDVTPYIYTLF